MKARISCDACPNDSGSSSMLPCRRKLRLGSSKTDESIVEIKKWDGSIKRRGKEKEEEREGRETVARG